MVDYSAWSEEASAYTEAGSPPPPVEGIPSFADRTHTVSASATGTGNGTDANPWTLEQAMRNCQPGMIIGIRAGVYVGRKNMGEPQGQPVRDIAFHPLRGGTAEQPIYFVAQHLAVHASEPSLYSDIRSGMTEYFDGQAAFGIGTFSGPEINHVHFIGLYTNRDFPNNKIWMGDRSNADGSRTGEGALTMLWGRGNHCSIQYCVILSNNDRSIADAYGDNDACIRLELVSNVYISNCYFRISGRQKGVTALGSVNSHALCVYKTQYLTVENCYFTGYETYYGLGIHLKGQTDADPLIGGRFRYNKFYDLQFCFRLHANREQASEDLMSWAYGNLAIKTSALFTWTTSQGDYVFNGFRFFNNTIIESRRTNESGMYYLEGDHYKDGPPVRNIMMFNNLGSNLSNYFHCGYGTYRNLQWVHDFAVMDRNLIHNNINLFRGGDNLTSITWEQWSTTGDDANSIYQQDPQFIDNVDYKPAPGSPAIGAGRDLLGAFGPVDGVVNIGCYATGTEVVGIKHG